MDRHQPDHYSDEGFWEKVTRGAKSLGTKVLRPGFELYYSLESSDTPMWAKSVAVGALGYFILPIDLVPDFAPVIGFADDIVTMSAAISSLGRYVTKEIKDKAEKRANGIVGL